MPGDDVAATHVAGVPGRRRDDTDRGAAHGARDARADRRRARTRVNRSSSDSSSSGRTTCVSGSPKRALNSSTRTPSRREHQPRVQTADKGIPLLPERVDARVEHGARNLLR